MRRTINNPQLRKILRILLLSLLLPLIAFLAGSVIWDKVTQQNEENRLTNEVDQIVCLVDKYLGIGLYEDALDTCDSAFEKASRIVSESRKREFQSYIVVCQGICHQHLATTENKKINLKRALVKFGYVVDTVVSEENRVYYARALLGLGDTYWAISEIDDIQENLSKAIDYYQEALEVYTVSDYPFYQITASRIERVKKILEEFSGRR